MEKKTQKVKAPAKDRIEFYRLMHKNGFLSNFYPSQIKIDGKIYKTVEHYFQSQKFKGLPEEQVLIDAKTPN